MGDLGVLGLRRYGACLAVHLLEQEIELLSDRPLLPEGLPEFAYVRF